MSQFPGEDVKGTRILHHIPIIKELWLSRTESITTRWIWVTWKSVWGAHWDAESSPIFLVMSILLNHGWLGRQGILVSVILKKIAENPNDKKKRGVEIKLKTSRQNDKINRTRNSKKWMKHYWCFHCLY